MNAAGLAFDAFQSGQVAVFVTDIAVVSGFGMRGVGHGSSFGVHRCCRSSFACWASKVSGALSWDLAALAAGVRSKRRSSWALRATTAVEADIRSAPTLIGRTNPIGASTPAARGTAAIL